MSGEDDPEALQKWIQEKYDVNNSIEASLSEWDVITITAWRVEGDSCFPPTTLIIRVIKGY